MNIPRCWATAEAGNKYIKSLYRIEAELRAQNLEDDDLLSKRKELTRPVLEAFKSGLRYRT